MKDQFSMRRWILAALSIAVQFGCGSEAGELTSNGVGSEASVSTTASTGNATVGAGGMAAGGAGSGTSLD